MGVEGRWMDRYMRERVGGWVGGRMNGWMGLERWMGGWMDGKMVSWEGGCGSDRLNFIF